MDHDPWILCLILLPSFAIVMQNFKLEHEHWCARRYFSWDYKNISQFPEKKYKRIWKSANVYGYVVIKQKISIFCHMQNPLLLSTFTLPCWETPSPAPNLEENNLWSHYIFHYPFRMFMVEWRIEGSLKNFGCILIQGRNTDFLRNTDFTFLNNVTISVVRLFRKRFFTFYVSLRPGTESHKPVKGCNNLLGWEFFVLHWKWVESRFKKRN